jgi:hypothetical protein
MNRVNHKSNILNRLKINEFIWDNSDSEII